MDDTEKPKLRDIQDQPIQSYGKKIADVKFMGDVQQEDMSMDVSDVGKDVIVDGQDAARWIRHALHRKGSQVLEGARRKVVQNR